MEKGTTTRRIMTFSRTTLGITVLSAVMQSVVMIVTLSVIILDVAFFMLSDIMPPPTEKSYFLP